MAAKQPICPECGTELTPSAPRGLCSRCLVANALSLSSFDSRESFAPRKPSELQPLFPDFDIRRLIGRGGMGAVYEASQKSLNRIVALKILPPELLRTSDFFDRFQREAQVMARMDHPNVARVYDSDLTANGEAFIIMELVAGVPITQYAADKHLNLSQKLNMFLQVCSGVEHAHQKGIIHRDLKPSNILVAEVNGVAVPKVIDFGLAKPAEQSQHDSAVWLSSSQAVGTPAYISPEQAAGKEIDSRSDIYSLGTLLFELLAGHPPIEEAELNHASRSVIANKIQSIPIRRPSECKFKEVATASETRRSPKMFHEELQGDLDAIVLKALDKTPENRYETVTGLADDVRSYLLHHPVRAVAPTRRYLFRKFCRRHRTALGIAGLLLFFTMTGIGLLIRESVLTRQAERLAAERLERGEKLIEFMLGDLHGKLYTVGRLDILETTVEQIEAFYARNSTASLPPESLRNRAHAKVQLGRIRNSQGKPELAKTHYEEAICLYEAALNRKPQNVVWKEELGQAWNSLAVFHHSRGEAGPAQEAYQKALGPANDLLRAEPQKADWADFKASVLHNYAALCETNGRLKEAEEKYSEALHLWTPLLAAAPDNIQLLEHLSHLHLNLAFLHGRLGQLDKAEHANAEALRMREQIVQLNTNSIAAIDLLADIQQNIAQVHLDRNRLVEAEEWMNHYRPTREQLARHDPSNTGWRSKLADAWSNLGHLRARQGQVDQAAEAFQKSCSILESPLSEAETPSPLHARWLEKLSEAGSILEQFARQEEKKHNRQVAHQAWQHTFDFRLRLANESLTNHQAHFELALASLELAMAQHAGKNDSAAKSYALLSVILLERCAFYGFEGQIQGRHLQVIRELTGISLDPAISDESNKISILLRKNSLTKKGITNAYAALDHETLRLPQKLAEVLRQQNKLHAASQ